MDVDSSIYSLLILVLLLLSALFSGSEVAFFSINNLYKEQLTRINKKSAQTVLKLLQTPRRLLITILIGNTLVNVTLASVATMLTLRIGESLHINKQLAILINIIVVTFFILVISEISPKIFAAKNPVKFSLRLSYFLLVFYYLFLPISATIAKIIIFFTIKLKIKEDEEEAFLQSSEFQALLDIGEEQGELEQEEKEMIHHIFEFGDTTVREIMVPRTDMICIDHNVDIDELLSLIKAKGHTRIPVFKESIDKIAGIINAKDLLPFMNNSMKDIDFLQLARSAMFVPESKKIDDLLRNFQAEQQHMAIVVDEYGGTSGLVTLEDIIEEIVGEIRDEYDKVQTLYKKVDEKTVVVDAKIDIDSLNEIVKIDLPESDDYDTLGGFILENTGSLPEVKDLIVHGEYELIMEKVEKNRIVTVKITHNPNLAKLAEEN